MAGSWGEVALQGLKDPVRLYEVRWQEESGGAGPRSR